MTWYLQTHRSHLRRAKILAACGVEFTPLRALCSWPGAARRPVRPRPGLPQVQAGRPVSRPLWAMSTPDREVHLLMQSELMQSELMQERAPHRRELLRRRGIPHDP
ncbi:MAG: hypothetical protein ACRDSG_04935 [Pseudonocardiaceae bacterium]